MLLVYFFNDITVKGNLKSPIHKNIFNIIICVSVIEATTSPVSKNNLVHKEMLCSCQGVFLKNFSNPEGFNARGTTVVLSENG